jgi:hypothetical protein
MDHGSFRRPDRQCVVLLDVNFEGPCPLVARSPSHFVCSALMRGARSLRFRCVPGLVASMIWSGTSEDLDWTLVLRHAISPQFFPEGFGRGIGSHGGYRSLAGRAWVGHLVMLFFGRARSGQARGAVAFCGGSPRAGFPMSI